MQLTASVLVASMATSTLAINMARGFSFPDTVSLVERQEGGTKYECHANCGYALQGSEEEGYCKDPEWVKLFNGCLECALDFDIWKHYGGGLTPAAKACGLDATPKPADSTTAAEETTAAETTAAETTAAETTAAETTAAETTVAESSAAESSVVETTAVESSAAQTSAAQTSAAQTSAVWTTSAVASSIPASNATSTAQPPVVTAGASNMGANLIAAGAAVLVAANLM